MGKQKQQRRSAKKKKGGTRNAAGTKNEAQDETAPTLKCTACRQVVTEDTSIACPVPECDRIFCTQRCSAKCILRCVNDDCPCPERCRPCASGKTRRMLKKRERNEGEKMPRSKLVLTMFDRCEDGCGLAVCVDCTVECEVCSKHVCVPCGNECIVGCSKIHCTAKHCASCADSFDGIWGLCKICSCKVYDGHMARVGSLLFERGEAADQIVLQYAAALQLCLDFLSSIAHIPFQEVDDLNDESICEMKEALKKILPGAGLSEDVTLPERLEKTLCLYYDKDKVLDAERKAVDVEVEQDIQTAQHLRGCLDEMIAIRGKRSYLQRAVLDALLPDVVTSFGAFSEMKSLMSDNGVHQLENLFLDLMQTLYQKKQCGHCFRNVGENSVLQRCGGCKAMYYCDENCQALSWPTHSRHCACMKEARKEYSKRVVEKNAPKHVARPAPQANENG